MTVKVDASRRASDADGRGSLGQHQGRDGQAAAVVYGAGGAADDVGRV